MISAARAVAWRGLHNYLTNPALVVPSLMFPLIFFAGFAGGLSAVSGVPGFNFAQGYTAFQYCFVLVQASAFGGVFGGFSIAADFEFGFARRLMLSAADRRGILLGYLIVGAARWAITVAVITLVALLVGMNILGNGSEILAMFALAFLVNLTASLWSAGMAMRFRTIQAGPLIQTPVFLILFLAPVFVPLSLLQGWVEFVAHYNPATLLLESVRGLLAADPFHTAEAFAVAGGLVLLFGVFALRGLRSAEKNA